MLPSLLGINSYTYTCPCRRRSVRVADLYHSVDLCEHIDNDDEERSFCELDRHWIQNQRKLKRARTPRKKQDDAVAQRLPPYID